jgi:hypothetical protein
MKKKDKPKSKTKKSGSKKQVKRPAHKKPRPKKYIEARIPKQTKEKQQEVAAKEAAEPNHVTLEEALKEAADVLSSIDVFAESPPVPGVIRRQPYNNERTGRSEYVETEPGHYVEQPLTDSTYIRMLKEEEEESRKIAQARSVNVNSTKSIVEKPSLLSRFLNLFRL